MYAYFVNSNTSVIPILSRQLVSPAIVYVPSTAILGQLITVKDADGYISSPQSIIVSTLNPALFTGGLSSIAIKQGYGYITLRAVSSNEWSILDENAFADPLQSYAIKGLATESINSVNSVIDTISSTGSLFGNTYVGSTLQLLGPLFVNSMQINSTTAYSDTYTQNGSLYTLSNIDNYSSLIAQQGAFQGSVFTQGPLSTTQAANITGNLTFSTSAGVFNVLNTISTAGHVTMNTISTGGTTSLSSLTRILNNLYTSTLTTNANIEIVLNTNDIKFLSNTYLLNRPDITVQSPTYIGVTTPVLEMQQGIHISTNIPQSSIMFTNELFTTNLYCSALNVTNTISTPGLAQANLQNAQILNGAGSLVISSVTTSYLTLNNAIYGPGYSTILPLVSTGNAIISSVAIDSFIQIANQLNTPTIVTDTCSTNTTITSSLLFGDTPLNINGLVISSFFVSSAFIANEMSSFVVQSALFNNLHGVLNTSNTVLNTATTSSLFGVSYITSASPILISTPLVTLSNLNVSSGNTANPQFSTLFATGITFGTPISTSTASDPYITTSTISGFSTNTAYEFITGQGIPYNPLEIRASMDRVVNIYFQNTSSFSTRFLTLQYTYQNNGSAVGSAGLRMVNNGIVSTIVSFNASPIQGIQTASLSNFPVNPNLIQSTYQYYLTGPTTYTPPSTTVSRNIVLAGGTSPAVTIAYSSDGGRIWAPLRFTGLTSSCMGIARGSNKWIAAGEGTATTLMFSYTGTVWYSLGKSIFSVRGKSVAWNGVQWVAVGEGTNSIAYSLDGVSWTGLGTSIFTVGTSVAWSGSLWVATGSNTNTLAYSADGSNWTGLGTSVFSQVGTSVAWGGRWVATGQGDNTLAYSADGLSWTGLSTTVFQQAGTTVAWNGSQWLAGSSDTVNKFAVSVNGSNWTGITESVLSNVNAVSYAASNWIATGEGSNTLAYSANGSNWTGVTASTIFRTGYALANSEPISPPVSSNIPVFVTGSSANMYVTNDSVTWSTVTTPFTDTINTMIWTGKLWVAGGPGSPQLAYSADGTNWTGVTLTIMNAVYGLAIGPNSIIAVGSGMGGYTRATSTDGINWTEVNYSPSFFPTTAYKIAWGGAWVAAGAGITGGLVFSLDSATWITPSTAMFNTGRAVRTNGRMWLAGGDVGPNTLAYSYDGAVWIGLGATIFTSSVYSITWGNNLWVAVGAGTNSIAYSFDGINWIGIGTSLFTVGTSVAWNGTKWFATGIGSNTLIYSLDGVTWVGLGTSVIPDSGIHAVSKTILPNTAVDTNEPVGILWDVSGTLVLSPSVIEKPVNSLILWNSRASSLNGYTMTASLSFGITQLNTDFMIGFSEQPRATNSYTGLNYAFSITSANLIEIYELGALVATVGALSLTSAFLLEFTGTAVNYYLNSTLVRTTPRIIGNPLYLSSSFRSPGCRVIQIEFHPRYQITGTRPVPDQYSYLASITPARDDTQYISYSMPMPASGLTVGKWQFDFPISGNLSTTSTSISADLCVNSSKLFSTPVISNVFYTTPSTYSLAFNISTTVSTLTTDTLSIRFRTLRGTGETYFYNAYSTPTASLNTVVTNDSYNLSSIGYLQLYHTSFDSGLQTSDMAMWLNPLSTNTQSFIDSNAGITMNKGYMKWNNRLYGISIQNRYNDMQGRNITYSGALYNASDSNLKHSIEYADVSTLYDTIDRLPLRYYSFSGAYLSTFQPADRHQLGVLTTEVRPLLPTIVNEVRPAELGLSTLETIDKAQLKFAHLGATQYLIQKVSTLSGQIMRMA